MPSTLSRLLMQHASRLRPVIPIDPVRHRMVSMDLSASNGRFVTEHFLDPNRFDAAVNAYLAEAGADFAYGGYGERREMYAVSAVFDGGVAAEPRRLHLGIDIWGPAGTPVCAPLEGWVHSQGFLPVAGDYGGVVILRHDWEGEVFHTLYGHLAEADIRFREGDPVAAGARIGHFGQRHENGCWPPHLHLQLVRDMGGMRGDYPGVCRSSEHAYYLENCPDPGPLLAPILTGLAQRQPDASVLGR
jgi:murein DD-endopeptidase MepM/ murein hydrolase activator NlpD